MQKTNNLIFIACTLHNYNNLEEMGKAYSTYGTLGTLIRILVEMPEGKRLLGRP
jgi:hypothetical protein